MIASRARLAEYRSPLITWPAPRLASPFPPGMINPSKPLSIVLTNDLHQTRARINQRLGQPVSLAILKRIRRQLCPREDCPCRRSLDATFGSVYGIGSAGAGRYVVVLTPPSGPSR